MLDTTARLNKLEHILSIKRAPVLKHLNPGLPKEEVQSFLSSNNIKPLPGLVALYEWHNGVKSIYGFLDGMLELLPFGKLFNLDEMIEVRETFNEWASEEWAQGNLKDFENYIPILGTGESDMYLLDMTTGEILVYQPMIQTFGELEFYSIDAMIDCIIECYEKNAFTIDENEGLEVNFTGYFEIKNRYKI